jgi:exosortase A-associated hydrolase 2
VSKAERPAGPPDGARPATELSAWRLAGAAGSHELLSILHEPAPGSTLRGLVLHVPAFAEEMNKSRRMVALAAGALADAGFAVLLPDLHGCGDSDGEFVEAGWAGWVADIRHLGEWLAARLPGAPLWLWGHRAGALLAAEAAVGLDLAGLLLWQPVPAGAAHLQQFLRIRLAAETAAGGGAAAGRMAALRDELASQGRIEVAGYELPVAVAQGLEAARLAPPDGPVERDNGPRHLVWLETSLREPLGLLPASEGVVARFSAAGWEVTTQVVAGPAFWQTVEIEEAPDLAAVTARALSAAVRTSRECAQARA